VWVHLTCQPFEVLGVLHVPAVLVGGACAKGVRLCGGCPPITGHLKSMYHIIYVIVATINRWIPCEIFHCMIVINCNEPPAPVRGWGGGNMLADL
jgi:hypothetical protein